jgi:hypothetical protein
MNQKRTSVDFFDSKADDPNAVIGTVAIVDGVIVVTSGGEGLEDLITYPAGDSGKRGHKLVLPSQGYEYLVALVEQYGGSGLRADWSR